MNAKWQPILNPQTSSAMNVEILVHHISGITSVKSCFETRLKIALVPAEGVPDNQFSSAKPVSTDGRNTAGPDTNERGLLVAKMASKKGKDLRSIQQIGGFLRGQKKHLWKSATQTSGRPRHYSHVSKIELSELTAKLVFIDKINSIKALFRARGW